MIGYCVIRVLCDGELCDWGPCDGERCGLGLFCHDGGFRCDGELMCDEGILVYRGPSDVIGRLYDWGAL